MKYKKSMNKSGRTMYYRQGKLIKEADVPKQIIDSREYGTDIELPETIEELRQIPEEKTIEAMHPERSCIFCGQYGKYTKFIHGQTVYLCEADYNTKSTGQVGGKVRELYAV